MSMNDRYRNVRKAHDHIVKCRAKESTRVFIPYWGYAFIPSDALLMARIRRDAFKGNKEFNQWARSYYEKTMQGVQV